MTSLVVIEPHQRAMVLTFGKPSAPLLSFGDRDGDEVGPGLHIVAPWPMTEVFVPVSVAENADGEDVVTRTATGVRILRLGTNPPEPDRAILWTNDHTQIEVFSLVQPARFTRGAGGEEGTDVTDLSLVAVEMPVQYAVEDVRLFAELAQPDHRDRLLEMLGERALMRELSWRSIDTVLGGERVELARDIAVELARVFAEVPSGEGTRDAGVRLMHVGIAGVHPPQEAARMFERVVQARQVKEANIEAANEDKIRILTEVAAPIERAGGRTVTAPDIVALIDELTSMREAGVAEREIVEQELAIQHLLEEAGGAAGAALIAASAERWDMHMGERGKAALFAGQVAGYRAAPAVYMASKYFDALLETMRSARVYLTSEQLDDLRVILELQTRDTSLELFDPEAGGDMSP
jgi:regulator of protease activity HflC (stomatin/prohibitin superfamily)